MSKAEKYAPLELFRTFWPVLLFVAAFLVWALNKQTVSNVEFIALEIRTALIEEEMPDKNRTLKLYESMASVETSIEQLSKSMTRIENQLLKMLRKF